MRKLSALMYAFTAAALLFTSCGGDDETDPLSPTIAIGTSAPATVTPDGDFSFTVDVRQGDAKLKTLTLREDGDALNASRVTIDGETAGNSEGNYDISSNSIVSFTINAGTQVGTYHYTVGVQDKDELSASLEFDVIVKDTEVNSGVKLYSTLAQASEAGTIGSFYSVASNTTGTSTAFVDAGTESSADFVFKEVDNSAARTSAVAYTYYLEQPGTVTAKANFTTTTTFASSSLTFATVTKSDLEGIGTGSANVGITAGSVYEFYNTTTKIKGLINVISIDSATDLMTFDVKFIENVVVINKAEQLAEVKQ